MKRLTGREWGVVTFFVVLLGVILYGRTGQKIKVRNPRSSGRPVVGRLAPLGDDKLVFLDVEAFGYAAYLRCAVDAISYNQFGVSKGSLLLTEPQDSSHTWRVNSNTKIAFNLRQSTSAYNHAGRNPKLIDYLPWTYTATTPLLADDRGETTLSWLCHSLAISDIAQDGTVTIMAGSKRVQLRPGGEVTAERSAILWRSTVSIRHRGVLEKKKVERSKWLRVEGEF